MRNIQGSCLFGATCFYDILKVAMYVKFKKASSKLKHFDPILLSFEGNETLSWHSLVVQSWHSLVVQ